MIPIEACCYCNLKNFEALFNNLLEIKDFKNLNEERTYSIELKLRNNNKYNKSDFISKTKELLNNYKNLKFLDYKGYYTIFIDITQHLLCFSIFDSYDKVKKYSINTMEKLIEYNKKINNPKDNNDNEKFMIKEKDIKYDEINNDISIF